MLVSVGSLLVGLVCLLYGSEWTVSAATSVAHRLGVSTLFVGVTIVAVGSSIPEIATSIYGSLYGTGDFVVAHVVGSATSQITLGIGVLSFATALNIRKQSVRRYGTAMLAAMTVMFVGVWVGRISRLAGAFMVVVYLAFLAFRFEHDDYRETIERRVGTGRSAPLLAGQLLVGLGLVVVGGHLLVTGARDVAVELGVPWYLLGVVTGLGTTTPEIAIGVSSMYRDRQSIAVGTLLGSNITDPLFSLGIGAVVGTLVLEDPRVAVLGTLYMLFASACVLLLAYYRDAFGRYEGAICVVLYLPTFLFS